jgi:hypothetical protein
VIKQPSYTLSVPDKRFYMLLKGITESPCFVRASNMSLHSRPFFTHGTFCLSFIWQPLHVRHAYV